MCKKIKIVLVVRKDQQPPADDLVAKLTALSDDIEVTTVDLLVGAGHLVPQPDGAHTLSDVLAQLYAAHLVLVYYPQTGTYTDGHVLATVAQRICADPLLATKTVVQFNWRPECKSQQEWTAAFQIAGAIVCDADVHTLSALKQKLNLPTPEGT